MVVGAGVSDIGTYHKANIDVNVNRQGAQEIKAGIEPFPASSPLSRWSLERSHVLAP